MIPIFAFRKSNTRKSLSLVEENSILNQHASSKQIRSVNSDTLLLSPSLINTFPFKSKTDTSTESINDDLVSEDTTADTKISEVGPKQQEILLDIPKCSMSHGLKIVKQADNFREISVESNNEYQNKRRNYGFHQNPRQSWQHYCAAGAGELLTLLQLQQQQDSPKTELSSASYSNNISRSRSDSTNTLEVTVKSDTKMMFFPYQEREENISSERHPSLLCLSLASSSFKSLKYFDDNGNSDDDDDPIPIFFCEEGISRVPFVPFIPQYSTTGSSTVSHSNKSNREFQAIPTRKRSLSGAFRVTDTPLNSPSIEHFHRALPNASASSSFPSLMSRIKSLSTLFNPAAITSSHSHY